MTILFCIGPQCAATPDAIEALLAAGYPAGALAYYRGGLHDWQTLGLPVEPGSAESEASDAHQLGALATESDLATNPLRSTPDLGNMRMLIDLTAVDACADRPKTWLHKARQQIVIPQDEKEALIT